MEMTTTTTIVNEDDDYYNRDEVMSKALCPHPLYWLHTLAKANFAHTMPRSGSATPTSGSSGNAGRGPESHIVMAWSPASMAWSPAAIEAKSQAQN